MKETMYTLAKKLNKVTGIRGKELELTVILGVKVLAAFCGYTDIETECNDMLARRATK